MTQLKTKLTSNHFYTHINIDITNHSQIFIYIYTNYTHILLTNHSHNIYIYIHNLIQPTSSIPTHIQPTSVLRMVSTPSAAIKLPTVPQDGCVSHPLTPLTPEKSESFPNTFRDLTNLRKTPFFLKEYVPDLGGICTNLLQHMFFFLLCFFFGGCLGSRITLGKFTYIFFGKDQGFLHPNFEPKNGGLEDEGLAIHEKKRSNDYGFSWISWNAWLDTDPRESTKKSCAANPPGHSPCLLLKPFVRDHWLTLWFPHNFLMSELFCFVHVDWVSWRNWGELWLKGRSQFPPRIRSWKAVGRHTDL